MFVIYLGGRCLIHSKDIVDSLFLRIGRDDIGICFQWPLFTVSLLMSHSLPFHSHGGSFSTFILI